jgi:L-fuconolactonase
MPEIVDAQIHVWANSSPERPWPPGRVTEAHRAVPYTADEVIHAMESAGVDRAILVPPSWEGNRNDVALEAVARFPQRLAVMGRLDLSEGPISLAHWREQPGMLGVRLTFHREEDRRALAAGFMEPLWREAEAHGIPVMVYAPGSLAAIQDVARRFAGLRIIIDHAGLPLDTTTQNLWARLTDLWPLASQENVFVKASALPCHVVEEYPFPTLQKVVDRLVQRFGAQRLFWGSDLSRLPCPYADLVQFFCQVPALSAGERAWVLGQGVMNCLGWK